MKKSLITLAVLGSFGGVATAQSSVTLSGYLDTSVIFESGARAGSVRKVGSGVSGPSRLIFSGREDLGGGMMALFHLEHGVTVDTGGSNQPNFFGRQSFVGLNSSSAGTLRLGNMFHSMFATVALIADPCGNSYTCSASNLMTGGAGAGPNANGVIVTGPGVTSGATLVNPGNGGAAGANAGANRANMISYTTPRMAGFDADIQYAFGEVAGSTAKSHTISLGARYRGGPVVLAANVLNTNDTNGADDKSNLIAGTYDFGVVKLHAAYGTNKYSGALGAAKNNSDAMLGVSARVGPGRLMASYIKKNDKLAINRDATQWGVAYSYPLSKRTALHASMGRLSNKNGATYSVGTPAGAATPNPFVGSSSRVVAFGVAHSF